MVAYFEKFGSALRAFPHPFVSERHLLPVIPEILHSFLENIQEFHNGFFIKYIRWTYLIKT